MAKCSHCGADLPDGEVICPSCGREIQLVPDYETLDLNVMVAQNGLDERHTQRLENQREQRKKDLKNIRLIRILLSVAIAAVAAIGISAAVMTIRATMTSAQDYDNVYKQALEQYEAEDYQNAYNTVEKALEFQSDSQEAQILKAKIAFKLDKADEAVNLLRSLISNDEECVDAYQALLDIYVEQGAYDQIYEFMSGVSNTTIRQQFADYLVEAPLFSMESGVYNEEQEITLTSSSGLPIYYTTDGSDPTNQSTLYTEPIHIGQGETVVKAVSINDAGIYSPTETRTYEINFDAPSAPVIETASGEYTGDNNKIVINVPEGCTAYYAFDAKPTTEGAVYTGPIGMLEGKHFFYAILVNEKGVSGAMSAATYTYTPATEVTENTDTTDQGTVSEDTSGYTTPSTGGNDSYYDYNYGGNSSNYNPTPYYPDYTEPTEDPVQPTVEPTEEPTVEPTEEPTIEPTVEPTVEPTATPENETED